MQLFDTHCHLNSEELLKNIDEVIANANKAGITHFLVVGWNKESSLKAVELANKYKNVYAAIGFHPTDINDVSEDDFNDVMKNIDHPKVVAVGEIGLDYHWVKDPLQREKQKNWFIKQINFANEHNKPISIHNRDAFEDCLNILKKHKPIHGGVVHCYSGSVELLNDVIKLGLFIGICGPLTFTNAKTPKEVCEDVPLDWMVIETDSPYLAPHPLRGTVNEPKNLALIFDKVCEIKGLSKKHLAEITFKNSCRLFNIDYENEF